ncbi:transposase [Streptomyces kebangsaanensis]|uniref:transposase n=1 Tax=Streptomyces kebangsaanensis TaxID=864058 RepID=UPI00093D4FD6|nr:transposase [Streptomyces kebangsaanensis]
MTWAIEDGRGFARGLADGLLLAGHEVVWVPTRLMTAHHKLHAATGSKSDPDDATAVARAAIATARPHPGDLTRTPGLASLTTLLDTSRTSPHVHRVLAETLGEIDGLNRRIRDLEATIKELVSPLAPALLEITGISHVSAAVLLAEIGDITRFASSAKLARYTGCAPIPVYSSDRERHRLHRGGNRRLNSLLYTTAIVQQRFHPGARELLARHTPTKDVRGARRVLKRHLIDVIHRAMVQDRASRQHHITQHELVA